MAFQLVKILDNPVEIMINVTPKGAYNALTSYQVGDSVSYNYSSYIAIGATTGNLPTNTTYWQLLAGGSAPAGTRVDSEVLSGTVNGTNKTFTMANTPTSGVEHIYGEDGRRLRPTVDYTISGLTVTLTNAPVEYAPIADYTY